MAVVAPAVMRLSTSFAHRDPSTGASPSTFTIVRRKVPKRHLRSRDSADTLSAQFLPAARQPVTASLSFSLLILRLHRITPFMRKAFAVLLLFLATITFAQTAPVEFKVEKL